MNITSFHVYIELYIEHQQMLPFECYLKGSILHNLIYFEEANSGNSHTNS